MYLIDTVVLSELRKRERHAGIVRWLHAKAVDALFLSAITIGEIERRVLRQHVKNRFSPRLCALGSISLSKSIAIASSPSTCGSRVDGDGSARGSVMVAPIY